MPPTIQITVKTDRFRYLWLKYVRGFDISRHCARCLIGDYSRLIQYGGVVAGATYGGALNEADAPYAYLCGVTPRWSENLHVAMAPEPGSIIEHEDSNVIVRVEGMRRLEIPPVTLDLPKAFTTCRNFQFGYAYLRSPSPASPPAAARA